MYEIESRGRDATGYAYVSLRDKSVYLAKAPVQATEFLKIPGHILTRPGIQRMPRAMLLHTRSATQGLPEENKNNHPIYAKASGLCMIHNGWLTNDDALVEEHKLEVDAEVDTEVYLRLIEKYYLEHPAEPVEAGIKEATGQVFGSIACAMIQAGRPGSMWIWKDQGQLMIARTDWGVVFASTRDALLRSLMYSCSSFDLIEFGVIEPKAGTLLTLNANGVMKLGSVATPDWNSMPGKWTSRVYRTYVNGNVTSVRRAHNKQGGSTSYSQAYNSYDDEYGWFHGQGYQQQANQQVSNPVSNGNNGAGHTVSYRGNQRLPYFSNGGQTPAHQGASQATKDEVWGSNYQLSKGNLPVIAYADRCIVHLNKDPQRPKDCFCRTDYCCMRCGAGRQYYGIPVDEVEAFIVGARAAAQEALTKQTVKE